MSKTQSCCFTGHRPSKLSWGYDEEHPLCLKLKIKLANAIEEKITQGVRVFYTGMAQGTDIWAAEIVVALKQSYPEANLRLIAVLPFEGQANKWSEDWRERYFDILAEVDDTVILQAHYSSGCMQVRNRYLVDNVFHLIAVYNGEAGGTKYTIDYAKRKGLGITIIDPNDIENVKAVSPYLWLVK